jgi:predicted phage terminase large subunit-like protein
MTEITLPRYHAKQGVIADGLKRFNILRCGRRFGKTEMDKRLATEPALKALPVGYFAPTYKVLLPAFNELESMLAPITTSRSKIDKRIELVTGGVIEGWSLDNPDAGRSRKYARAILDEPAMVRGLKDIWEQAIRPTLSDLKGDAIFSGTPKGLNDFYELHNKAERGDEGWATFHATTYDNPYIDPKEVDEAKRDLPSIVFQQEYLAEFVSGAGALIDREWLRYSAPPPIDQLDVKMGVDFGVSQKTMADYTAIAVIGRESVEGGYRYWVLDVDRMRGTLQDVLSFITRKASIWHPSIVTVESVQAQAWAAQELIRTTTLPINALNPQNYGAEKNDKVGRSQSLRGRYEHGLVYHAPSITTKNEFEDELLSFPIGAHDDMVDALVYAYYPFSETGSGGSIAWL